MQDSFRKEYSSTQPTSHPTPRDACKITHSSDVSIECYKATLAYVERLGVSSFHIDTLHICTPNCSSAADVFGNGTYFVCRTSLKSHHCRKTFSGVDSCTLQLRDNAKYCALSGHLILEDSVDSENPNFDLRINRFTEYWRHGQMTGSKLNNDGKFRSLKERVGLVIGRLFDTRNRDLYNLNVDVQNLFRQELLFKLRVSFQRGETFFVAARQVIANSRYRLVTAYHTPYRLLRLETCVNVALLTALSCLPGGKSRKIQTCFQQQDEVAFYVVKCVVEGFSAHSGVTFSKTDFEDLAPCPCDRFLKIYFHTNTTHLTKVTNILHDVFLSKSFQMRYGKQLKMIRIA